MKQIIYDCDTGIDDALAILLGVMSKKLDFKGISTVAGNSNVMDSTKNTIRVLQLLQKDIPVYKGAERPLVYDLIDAEHVHGEDGMGNSSLPLIDDDEVTRTIQNKSACEFIVESTQKYNCITIVTTGPLTNLALAILSGDLVKENIEEVIVMGGVMSKPGNITISAEFNIFVDPHAAHIVFNAGLPITLVPLDITHEVILTPEFLEKRIKDDGGISTFIREIVEFYHEFYIKKAGEDGCPLHDPLAMGICIDKNFASEIEPENLNVVRQSESYLPRGRIGSFSEELIRGQIIAERRKGILANGLKPNVNVCLGIKSEEFLDFFAETLNGQYE